MGWEQLKEILDENRKENEERARQPITECPECCFNKLVKNKEGKLLCPICGWNK